MKKYINREISWLKFNARVLQEAIDRKNPLLERLRFLGIYSNNLDEFYKVRYAYLVRLIQMNENYNNIIKGQSIEGLIEEINKVASYQQEEYDRLYDEIITSLNKEKIVFIDETEIKEDVHRRYIEEFFTEELSHNLSIIIRKNLQTQDKMPLTKDGSLYLVITMFKKSNKLQHALIEVPTDIFPRFIVLPSIKDKQYIIFLEDIIRYHLNNIFQIFRYEKIEANAIKITQDADLSIDNDIEVSFLERVSEGLKERNKGQAVRIVYDKSMNDITLQKVKKILKIDEFDSIVPGRKYLNKKDFMKFPILGRKDLEYKKFKPIIPFIFQKQEHYFKAIAKKDVLFYTPYYDYTIFLKILRAAAIDPKVSKIKITVYRVANHSQVLHSLINAAKNGKEVTVVLELRARFDEAHNIEWSKRLQDEGIKVIFGVPGLKVHSKIGIIERILKPDRIEKYSFISTGNFHEGTAKFYTDLLLLTANPEIYSEIDEVFDFFEANYKGKNYKYLSVSPFNLRRKIIAGIKREIRNKQLGFPAQINIKVNSICDRAIIDELYEASNHGVEVRMLVRGICSLVPGVEGMSKNIKIISVVDRFLEHSRIFWFHNNGNDDIFISSADLMSRNLDYRIEVACPIYDEINKATIKTIFELGFSDNVKGREVKEELKDEYQKGSDKKNRSQETIYEYLKLLEKK